MFWHAVLPRPHASPVGSDTISPSSAAPWTTAVPSRHCVTVQMLRRYWLLSALLDRQWASQKGNVSVTDQRWHASLGRLAAATPELAPSSDSPILAARIEAEMAPQQRVLGPRGQMQHLQGAESTICCSPSWVLCILIVTRLCKCTVNVSSVHRVECRCSRQPGWRAAR